MEQILEVLHNRWVDVSDLGNPIDEKERSYYFYYFGWVKEEIASNEFDETGVVEVDDDEFGFIQ